MSATDGVFDNLFSHEILSIVREYKLKHPKLCRPEQAKVIDLIIGNSITI